MLIIGFHIDTNSRLLHNSNYIGFTKIRCQHGEAVNPVSTRGSRLFRDAMLLGAGLSLCLTSTFVHQHEHLGDGLDVNFPTNRLLVTPSVNAMMTAADEIQGMVLRT